MKLFLYLLMLALLSAASAKVVDDFESECGQFFASGKSPTVFSGSQYKQICQTLNGVSYYATFYDTDKKIPVYSAYKFVGRTRCNRGRSYWYIEPKLDDAIEINMATEGSVNRNLRGKHQALNVNYVNSGYDRGHLVPVYQTSSQNCADATFTLTNGAPQNPTFNQIQWKKLERDIAEYLLTQCLQNSYAAYIVTGVVPSTLSISNGVNVPSHFWTAYCCLNDQNDQNNMCTYSNAFSGTNDNNARITEMSVAALEGELGNVYGTKFHLFLKKKNKNRQSIFK